MFRDQPLHGVAVYNPDLLSKDELIRLFVARQPLLDRLLGDIRREGTGAVQHHLLIGRRGMGKTTLLRRLAHAIDDDPALAAIWLPLTFPEEQYNVGHLSDFWLNCLDALGDRLERRGQTEHLGGLDDDIARITELTPEKARQEAALAHLEAMARRLDRRFVLLVDNVDLILDRVKADEWALRAALSTAPWLLLIGATSVGVESTYQYEAAFYDFFRVHALKGLDEPETFGLLRRLAETFDAPHVARLLDAEPGRIRTLRLLAGGNPRTLVLLFSLLSQGIEGNVRTDLERLLDHCTPLYKARFEAMAPQQQQVVDAMAMHWHPITAGDLAARLRMDVNPVSSQLNRLVRDGVVEKVAIHESRRAGFQVAERFFNIWYLMRASRRVRRHLVWLVEFLRLMYTPNMLAAMARRHLDGKDEVEQGDRLHHAETALALALVVQDTGLRYTLENEGLKALARDRHLRRQIAEMLDLDGDDAPLKDRAERMHFLAEAEELCVNAMCLPATYTITQLWRLVSESVHLDARTKRALLKRLTTSPLDATGERLLKILEAHRQRDPLWFGDDAEVVREAMREGDCDTLGDHPGLAALAAHQNRPALAVVAHLVAHAVGAEAKPPPMDESVPLTICAQAEQFARQGDWFDVERVARILTSLRPRLPDGWLILAESLTHQGRMEEASSAVDEATRCEAHTHYTWQYIAKMYLWLNANIEAKEALQKSLLLSPWSGTIPEVVETSDLRCGTGDGSASGNGWITLRGVQYAAVVHGLSIHSHGAAGEWDQVWLRISRLAAVEDEKLNQAMWPTLLAVFCHAVAAGQTGAALECLDDHGLTDRWRPLREALAAIVAGTRAVLTRVAPEIREPALVLIDQLKPDLPG